MSIFDKIFRRRVDPMGISLSSAELVFERKDRGVRIWRSPEGDVVGVFFFGLPPDLPKSDSVADFMAEFAKLDTRQGCQCVEREISTLAGLRVVRSLVKIPQEESGMTYVASYVIPFEGCSYVIKVQCEEHGITGVREATLLAKKLAEGSLELSDAEDGPALTGDWDPDARENDEAFPEHPASRARRNMARIEKVLVIDPAVRDLVQFKLPDAGAAG